jgi:DNA-binding CsgD family transcriptional regulator
LNGVSMGIPGVEPIRPGTHLCALYSGPDERDRLLFSFLHEGIRMGDKCLCLIDGLEPASVRARTVGGSTRGHPSLSAQLDVGRASDVYLESGRFSVEHMISVLSASLTAIEGAFPLLRAAGEMSWVLPQPPGSEGFFVYEAAVNHVVEQQPAVFMCLYDLQRFGVSMLVDVLKTHPKVLLDRAVLDNPDYLSPEEYLAEAADSGPPQYPSAEATAAAGHQACPDPWESLTAAELRVADLVADGMTNRRIAERMFLSPHTIDAHLKHIYTKLSIHSRVELTVLTMRHRARGS